MALLRLAEFLFSDFLEAELNGFIAFLFFRHLLDDHTGACLDDGNGNDFSRFVEDLGHPDLLADNGLLHYKLFLLRLLVAQHGSKLARRLAT